MEDVNANDKPDWQKEIKSNIGMNLAGLYLEGGDMEKQSLRIDGGLNIAAVATSW